MNYEEIKKIVAFEKYHFGSDKIWNNLPTNLKNHFLESFRTLHLKKNQIIFQENGIPTGIYFLKKGKVKKYKSGLNGKEQIFYIGSENELLGYNALLCQEYYSDTVETLGPCEIGFIPKDVFIDIYNSSNELKNQIIRIMGHEYGVLINHITIIAQYSVRERVAIMLLLLKDKYKKEKGEQSEITLTREDLANFVGTARENLIRILNEFKNDNIIETKGRTILVLKPKDLIKISNLHLV